MGLTGVDTLNFHTIVYLVFFVCLGFVCLSVVLVFFFVTVVVMIVKKYAPLILYCFSIIHFSHIFGIHNSSSATVKDTKITPYVSYN